MKMKKPRPFIHKLIYVDERQERLNEIEQRARQETQPSYGSVHLHGVFAAAQKRQQGRGQAWSIPMLLSLLLILIAIVFIVLFSNE